MDRRLLFAAFAALILEVTLLLGDLQLIPLFESNSRHAQTRTIGEVLRTWQNVRRKSSDSIVWDLSQAQDTVFENDSVLTLAQSSAHIKLKGDIEVHIGENTLVVLEPTDLNHSDGTMKLKFSRGGLNAKTQKEALRVDHADWEIEAKAGTELNVQQSADGEVNLEVLKGAAVVATQSGRTEVQSGTQTQIKGSTVTDPQQILETLSWKANKDQRLYTDHSEVRSSFQWTGRAASLSITLPNGTRETKDIETENQTDLVLPLGTTYLQLSNEQGVSRNLAIHVWQSPRIYHFSPLPRDRILSDKSTLFTWNSHASLMSYRWEASRDETFTQVVQTQLQKANRCQQALSEGAYFWRVVGIDEEGFETRPSAPSPIYAVPDPLAAPVLKKMQLRKPASQERPKSGASLWHWLITPAYAAGTWEAEFTWQEVPGADHYVIEISSTPDFYQPLVNTKVKKTTFIWTVSKLGRYYWRVAAGQSKRLGLFSAVSEAILTTEEASGENIITVRKPEPQEPVEKVVQLSPPPAPEAQPEPMPEPLPPQPQVASPTEPLHLDLELGVGRGLTQSAFLGDDSLQVKLNGTLPPSYTARLSGERFILDARFQPVTWMDKANSDLQPRLPADTWDAQALYRLSHWSWGVRAQNAVSFTKSGYEAVQLKTNWIYGPTFQYEVGETTRLRFVGSLGGGESALSWGVRASFMQFFLIHYFVSGEAEINQTRFDQQNLREMTVRLFCGWRW